MTPGAATPAKIAPMRSSPDITRAELLALAAGALALAVAMFWPLALHPATEFPKDLGDPLAQAWQLAWDGHALRTQPGAFFQANQFWPLHDTLAFSDALVGYAPLAAIGSGTRAAVARYDAVFLLASALASGGAYLLARELGAGVAGGLVAGAAYAYAPWRLEQGGHLHILSSGAIPLALFLLVRGHRRADARGAALVLAGWAAAAWQVSIGFSLGLPLLVALGTGAAVLTPWWWRAGRPLPPPAHRAATAAGVTLLLATAGVLGAPYVRVRDAEPQARRSAVTVAYYSSGPRMFLASSALNPVWGRASAGVRRRLPAVPEQTLFPGLTVVLLAAAGLGWARWRRGLRLGLLGGAVAFAVLSLGFETHGAGRLLPYRLLYDLVPGWSGIRVPERLNTFTSLALALLAAAGAARVTGALRPGRRRAALAAGLAALVLAEGAGATPGRWYPHPPAPVAPRGQAGLPGPLLHLPAGPQDNREYLLWSTDGLVPMVNGRSSLQPAFTARLLAQVRGFPDARSVERLRGLGVQTVVLHRDRTAGTPWAQWRRRPLRGLGIHRAVRGRVVVYRLR